MNILYKDSAKQFSMPRVAVLLAAFNGATWIGEQLASILRQELVHVHVFVSIDMSADNTLKIVEGLGDYNNSITILEYGQVFGGAAKNFFRLIRDVDFSSYDYVAFSDQDDIWLPRKLFRAVEQINLNSATAYSSDVLAFWDDGRKILVKKSHPQKRFDYLFEAAGPGCTYVFNVMHLLLFKDFIHSKWIEINGISNHDWFIYAFFRSSGYSWIIDSVPLMQYRQHSSNQVGVNSGWAALNRRLDLIRVGWFRSEVEKICDVLSIDRPQRLFILKSFLDCRRRLRDAIVLFCVVLVGLY